MKTESKLYQKKDIQQHYQWRVVHLISPFMAAHKVKNCVRLTEQEQNLNTQIEVKLPGFWSVKLKEKEQNELKYLN